MMHPPVADAPVAPSERDRHDSRGALRARFRLARGGFDLDVDFEAPSRGVTALFGPSGSGKTTVLRCVVGLERNCEGYFALRGEIWQDEEHGVFLPTHQRPLGYVFQEASLFPHLSVRRNLEFGWKRLSAAERQVSFDQAVDLLGLDHLLERDPGGLSGGERQRVAIARALLTSPKLLLMDEPLAALDHASKAEILPYLERLHDDLKIPVLYVSHSPDEVARLADHMVLLSKGRVIACGPLQETLARLDLPIGHGDDAGVVFDTLVASHDDEFHLTWLEFAGGRMAVSRQHRPLGHRVRVQVPARDVSLTLTRSDDSSILNILSARVVEMIDDTPAYVMVRLDAAGTALLARVTRKSAAALAIAPGKQVYAQVKSVAMLT